MKKLTTLLLSVALLSITLYAVDKAIQWNYDKGHAKVAFSVSHMTVSDCDGYFKDVDAKIFTKGDDFTGATAEMTIQVASVNTDNEKRDEHLRSADFFDAQKYPTITFKSSSITKAKINNGWIFKGKLTMHGVTKEMTFAAVGKTGVNPYSKQTMAGFKLVGKLNRKDFGIGADTPSAIVGENVNVTINAEFIKQ